MRARRSLVVAALAVTAFVFGPVSTAPAQERPAARVAYKLPGPQPLTMSNPIITAFVSLPQARVPGQKVYVSIDGPPGGAAPVEPIAAQSTCQEVKLPPLTKNGKYTIRITTELPTPADDGANECQGGSDLPGRFEVQVPDKPSGSSTSPGATGANAPGGAGSGGTAAARRDGRGNAGSASIAGIDVARFEADFDKLKGKAGPAAAPEEGFQSELRYAEPGERYEELGADEERGAGRATLPFVAGALLALDAFLLLRSIRSQVLRQPLLN